MHQENLIKWADVMKWIKWQAVWKTYVSIQHQTWPSKLGDQKEPKDQVPVTITKTLSQTLINDGDIVYCCFKYTLCICIFRSNKIYIYNVCNLENLLSLRKIHILYKNIYCIGIGSGGPNIGCHRQVFILWR